MKIAELYGHFTNANYSFTTDTRKIVEGCLFFALKGERFDGNIFAAQALEQGAKIAIVDDSTVVDGANKSAYVLVANVLKTMQDLATYHRRQFDIPILAVGGSNGKTTTKELLHAVLDVSHNVHATKGNFNNLIGVPITLLEMPLDTEFGIIEIGTNQFGEIAQLCNIVEPTCGLITNIGKEHLEGFGDIEGVTREESELYHYLNSNAGMAFVNADDPILSNMSRRLEKRTSYGLMNDADLKGNLVRSFPHLVLRVAGHEITSSLCGSYNAENIMAAIATVRYFDISFDDIIVGIGSYESTNNRSEYIRKGTNEIILDAYNANPSSVEKALQSFRSIDSNNKVVFLGDMLELGDSAAVEHRAILDLALNIPNCQCYFVGAFFMEQAQKLDAQCFESVDELIEVLKDLKFDNTWTLIKGSRGIQMEKVLDLL